MKSTLHAKQAIAELSPITLEFFGRMQMLESAPYTNAQKVEIRAKMASMLTPAQRAIVERESLRAAIELQHSRPERGNRAERRKVKKNLRRAEKRGE